MSVASKLVLVPLLTVVNAAAVPVNQDEIEGKFCMLVSTPELPNSQLVCHSITLVVWAELTAASPSTVKTTAINSFIMVTDFELTCELQD